MLGLQKRRLPCQMNRSTLQEDDEEADGAPNDNNSHASPDDASVYLAGADSQE